MAAAAAAAAEAAAEAAAARLAAAPPAWEVLLSAGADGALFLYSLTPGSLQPALQATLHLPRPHAGLTSSQSSRLWFTAAVVPPPPAVAPAEGPAGEEATAGMAAAEPKQQQQQVWLVTTSHGGGLLGWRVPLQAGPAPPVARAPQNIAPVRLPISHGRSVFTLHAVSTAALPAAGAATLGGDASAAASSSSSGGSHAGNRVGDSGSAGQGQPAEPQLLIMTSSMDRCLFMTRLPHPAVAAAAAVAAAPEGSWRRDAAAGTAGEASWKNARVDWRLTGLGAHVYGLSLLLPPDGRASPIEAVREGSARAAAVDGGRQAPPPPPPPPTMFEPQGEQPRGEHLGELMREEGQAQAEHLLLAVGCGDKTVRVLPLPPTSAGGEVSTGQQKQLTLWQGVTEKVTAVAWQPLLTDAAAGAAGSAHVAPQPTLAAQPGSAEGLAEEAAAPAAAAAETPVQQPAAAPAAAARSASLAGPQAAAAAVLAFGCEDGALGLMLPSREQALPLPVRHKVGVPGRQRWGALASTVSAAPASWREGPNTGRGRFAARWALW